jgi:hypothetical protein
MPDYAGRVGDIRRPGTCEINGPDKKNFLAMAINSNMNVGGGESRGTISRNYEGVGNPSVYPYFHWLFRLALRGDGLPFQRLSSKRAADSQYTGSGW